jgi:hypothetical protein
MRPMKNMLAALTAALFLSGVFFFLLPGCGNGGSDADKIEAVVKDMAEGAQAKDISRVKKHIAKEYQDPAGNDYDSLKGIMLFYFMQQGDINIFLRRQQVEVNGDRAKMSMNAVISRGAKVSDIKDIGQAEAAGFIFDLTFKRRGGDWLLDSAVWRQVGIMEAM